MFDFKQDFKNKIKLRLLLLLLLCFENFPCLVPPKNNIDFFKTFSWENILFKSPYYEANKKDIFSSEVAS
jgi:hypothetical protein